MRIANILFVKNHYQMSKLKEAFKDFSVSLIDDISFTVFVKEGQTWNTIEDYSIVPDKAYLFAANKDKNRLSVELRKYNSNQTVAKTDFMLKSEDTEVMPILDFFFKNIDNYETNTQD